LLLRIDQAVYYWLQ